MQFAPRLRVCRVRKVIDRTLQFPPQLLQCQKPSSTGFWSRGWVVGGGWTFFSGVGRVRWRTIDGRRFSSHLLFYSPTGIPSFSFFIPVFSSSALASSSLFRLPSLSFFFFPPHTLFPVLIAEHGLSGRSGKCSASQKTCDDSCRVVWV